LENLGDAFREARPASSGVPRYVRAVGKLVEIRIGRITSVADVESVHADILRVMGPSSESNRIVCADCRAAGPLPPDAVDAWSRGMRELNGRSERGALLIDAANAMFALQAERAVRCAGKPERHVFTDPEPLLHWLDAALNEPERSELRRFLCLAAP
jgi:hypothetical protein